MRGAGTGEQLGALHRHLERLDPLLPLPRARQLRRRRRRRRRPSPPPTPRPNAPIQVLSGRRWKRPPSRRGGGERRVARPAAPRGAPRAGLCGYSARRYSARRRCNGWCW